MVIRTKCVPESDIQEAYGDDPTGNICFFTGDYLQRARPLSSAGIPSPSVPRHSLGHGPKEA